MTFTDDDLKRLKERTELIGPEVAMSLWPHEMLALLARLLNAENAILHHGHGDCECVQRWKRSCGKKLDKSGIECQDK